MGQAIGSIVVAESTVADGIEWLRAKRFFWSARMSKRMGNHKSKGTHIPPGRRQCLCNPESGFETWPGLPGMALRPTCFLNVFILNSISIGLVTWITSTATSNLSRVIIQNEKDNIAARNAALWAATFPMAVVSSFAVFLGMHFVFGTGGGMSHELSALPVSRRGLFPKTL